MTEIVETDLARLRRIADSHPHPLLFATVSGAHLYGFPSPDSDWDLRGAHILPLEAVIGLDDPEETIERMEVTDGIELDLVTHDVRKFFRLLLRPNGYVLEQLLSPLVVHTTPEHAVLCALAPRCITSRHAHHYLGFAAGQMKLWRKEEPRRVKPLLYIYRVLLTGIHLMRSGHLNANLVELNEVFGLPYLPELIQRKLEGAEKGKLEGADLQFHESEYDRLVIELEKARDATSLPEYPSAHDEINDLLVRLRVSNR
ncbi:MAG: nucleotidyltransferase domain-containing protein [Planctomycetes bacterium]|nr:nucleotidyltransferase domain-containing protein [Planctomycetota bacterium]